MDDDRPFELIGDSKKRAWLTAYALTGRTDLASKAAGISKGLIYTPRWRDDDLFQQAREEARVMAADVLVDEATRRAVEGVKSYKFDKEGIPLRHPENCECGHSRASHVRLKDADDPERAPTTMPCGATWIEADDAGEEVGLAECDCTQFVGEPYFEHSYADTLLIFLTKGALPERYRDRMEVRGLLANLDLNLLPNALVDRIANGEHVEAVLAAGASEAGITPGELVRGHLAPGEPEEPLADEIDGLEDTSVT